jgi:hypothetical protein
MCIDVLFFEKRGVNIYIYLTSVITYWVVQWTSDNQANSVQQTVLYLGVA